MSSHCTVVIIGAGPAGISAALQLGRFGIPHLIFERSEPGGLLRNGNRISNYTGIPSPVTGEYLAERMADHLAKYSRNLIRSEVGDVLYDEGSGRFMITAGGIQYTSEYVIAACGTKPSVHPALRSIDFGLERYVETGITGLRGVAGETILVTGSGDCAFDYALTLAEANEVVIAVRGWIKALRSLKRRAEKEEKISILRGMEIKKISSGDRKPLRVEWTEPGDGRWSEFHRLVVAIGRVPDEACLGGMDPNLKVSLIRQGRLIPAGDIRKGLRRQALIAAGDGMEAAMKIHEQLRSSFDENSI